MKNNKETFEFEVYEELIKVITSKVKKELHKWNYQNIDKEDIRSEVTVSLLELLQNDGIYNLKQNYKYMELQVKEITRTLMNNHSEIELNHYERLAVAFIDKGMTNEEIISEIDEINKISKVNELRVAHQVIKNKGYTGDTISKNEESIIIDDCITGENSFFGGNSDYYFGDLSIDSRMEFESYLNNLPESLRDVIELRMQGYNNSEIADMLNISLSKVKRDFAKAKEIFVDANIF